MVFFNFRSTVACKGVQPTRRIALKVIEYPSEGVEVWFLSLLFAAPRFEKGQTFDLFLFEPFSLPETCGVKVDDEVIGKCPIEIKIQRGIRK